MAVSGIAIERKANVSRTRVSASTKAITIGSQPASTAKESRASAGVPPTYTPIGSRAERARDVVVAQPVDGRGCPPAAGFDRQQHRGHNDALPGLDGDGVGREVA